MLHVRVVSPAERTDDVLWMLRADPAAYNIALLRGAALDPAGDLILCDVAREGINLVLIALQDLGLEHEGSISVEQIAIAVGDAAVEAERQAPGHGTNAAVWEEVEARVDSDSTLTASFLTFLVIASLIAAIGLVEDAPILIVGAMVVGPEFGPIAALSVGLFRRTVGRVRRAATTLTVGFTTGTVAAFAATYLADRAGLVPAGFSPHSQPFTGFIVDPSIFSVVVAFLAGIAGTLSLTQAKAGALIGVLISVTTIPAVAAVGVAGALGNWDDALGAAAQLALNVLALVLAGTSTLTIERWAESRRS
jgi:uncharacterized hydrophobic protein (TIGR00271 family)